MKEYIDSLKLKAMFLGGTRCLEKCKDRINELNVFPVPDGDTGTNMSLTLMSAVKELKGLPEDASMDDVSSRIAFGTLKGARGNSGVIMSQLCRGFSKGIEGEHTLDSFSIAMAGDMAVQAAYRAVMKPQEGTILTVAREIAAKAKELAALEMTLKEFFSELLAYGREVLQKTPELLPVLKEAGVVDSGGQGLIEFLRGAFDVYEGKEEFAFDPEEVSAEDAPVLIDTSHIETADIKFGYCTEFIIESEHGLTESEEHAFKSFLSAIGDSIVCVVMDKIVKVHVHTNHPGQVIEEALTFGQLSSLKIDNMRIEHHEKVIREADRAKYRESAADQAQPVENVSSANTAEAERKDLAELGFVAVCSGEGLAEVFRGLKVDRIIEGGQTMNPSTEDILAAIMQVPAKSVIVLPNNGNIILAATQAAQLCTDKKIYVVPSRNICQGISAMIGYVPFVSAEENADLMTEACSMVKCGEVTYAIRDTHIGETEIRKGDYMGIGDGEILAVGQDVNRTAADMVRKLSDEFTEIITIYYGAGSGEEDADSVAEQIREFLPDADIEITFGGQNVYNFIISVE